MAKEIYPPPGAGQKRTPPPPPGEAPRRHPRPEEALTGTQQEWEEAVFRYADHFTVFRFVVRERGRAVRSSVCYKTFPEAVAEAAPDNRALVYAVTLEGRSFCVPRTEWPKYQRIWSER